MTTLFFLFDCVIYRFIKLLHCIFYKHLSLLHCIRYNKSVSFIEFEMAPPMEILTPFNYHQWKEDMEMQIRYKRLFKLTMETEVEEVHYVDKKKYWNMLDEAYGFLCL